MRDALLITAAFLLCTAGMAFLALAMKVHWQQVRGSEAQTPAVSKLLRILGIASLALSFIACLATDHVSMAVLVWVMWLAASALAVAFTLNWRPHWLAWLVAWAGADDRAEKMSKG